MMNPSQTNNTEPGIPEDNLDSDSEASIQLDNMEENATDTLSNSIVYCCACSEKTTEKSKFTCEICTAAMHLNCTILSSGPSSKLDTRICSLCATQNKIEIERQQSYSGQKRAAEKMTEAPNKKLSRLQSDDMFI